MATLQMQGTTFIRDALAPTITLRIFKDYYAKPTTTEGTHSRRDLHALSGHTRSAFLI